MKSCPLYAQRGELKAKRKEDEAGKQNKRRFTIRNGTAFLPKLCDLKEQEYGATNLKICSGWGGGKGHRGLGEGGKT